MNDGRHFPDRLDISPEVMAIARRLERAGFETWCVGGAVRDRLLGIPNNDIDLATSATPEQMQALFRRTVPVGISHGTVAILDRHNVAHEVTTFRKDVRTDGRHAEVTFGVTLKEDLARRDFTINAIAYHPMRHEWRDPHDGLRDIRAKLVRAVGKPAERFREDYLRILRCIRFATRFGFTIDEETWRAARDNGKGLAHLSAERVRDEWFKTVAHATSLREVTTLWSEVDADGTWLSDVRLGSTEVIEAVERLDRAGVRDPVFVTAYIATEPRSVLERLRCSRAEVERAGNILRHRTDWPATDDATSVRRWMSRVGGAVNDLVLLAEVDADPAGLREAVDAVNRSRAPISQSELAVSGADLLRIGVPEGPAVGAMLRRLLDIVLEDPSRNERAELLRIAMHDGTNATRH